MKYTPEKITHLEPHQIFVFGANMQGIHGAGAAKQALKWGAQKGKIYLQGQTYGLPTRTVINRRPFQLASLSLEFIFNELRTFDIITHHFPEKEFLVTKIGTGFAGYSIEEIAYLFKKIPWGSNVVLPIEFTI